MTKSATNTTITESMAEHARALGGDLFQVGANVFHAGVGVCVAAEDQVRGTFGRMVEKGKDYESDEDRLFSRATREVREVRHQMEQQVEKTVAATLHRAGVPSRDEINQLSRRVEALTRKVDDLIADRKQGTE